MLAMGAASGGCRKREARPKPETFTLANGLEVDLVPEPCGGGVVAVAVAYRVGTDHDPMGRAGLTRIVERLVAGARVGDDYTAVVAQGAVRALIDQAAAQMTTLPTDEMAAARQAALAEVAARAGGDAVKTARAIAAESVRPAPGAGGRAGIAAEIEAITPGEVAGFAQQYLKPGNARLVVAGRFDPKAVHRQIEAAFVTVPAGLPPVARPPVVATASGTLVMGDAPAAVAIAVAAPPVGDATFAAFLVLAAREVGDGGDGVSVEYDPVGEPRLLYVTGAVQPGEAGEAAAARLRGAVATMVARPLAPGDAAATKAKFAALLATKPCAEDPSGWALARARRSQLAIDPTALAAAIDAVTPAQLTEAAARFDAKQSAAVIAGGILR